MKKLILLLLLSGCGTTGEPKTVAEGACDRDVIYGVSASIAGIAASFDLHAKCIELKDVD